MNYKYAPVFVLLFFVFESYLYRLSPQRVRTGTILSIRAPRRCVVDDVFWVGDVLLWDDPLCGGYGELDSFKNKSILFIGDSQSRRLAQTTHLLLRMDKRGAPTMSELNKGSAIHTFLHIGPGIDFQWAPCMREMMQFVRLFSDYDYVFMSYGAHANRCKEEEDVWKIALTAFASDPHPGLIWRTQPLPSLRIANITHLKRLRALALRVWPMNRLHDHQRVMYTRDRENRIAGDTQDHLGALARIALLQYSNKKMALYP